MTRREHLEQLAKKMRVTIEYGTGRYTARINVRERLMYLMSWDEVPESEVYWVGLHELGHMALFDRSDESQTRDELRDMLKGADWGAENEARAWVWALDHSEFPLDQGGESSIAWGLADRLINAAVIGDGLKRIHEELGDDPDWYFNVTTPEHFEKLNSYAKPRWADLVRRLSESRVRVELPRA